MYPRTSVIRTLCTTTFPRRITTHMKSQLHKPSTQIKNIGSFCNSRMVASSIINNNVTIPMSTRLVSHVPFIRSKFEHHKHFHCCKACFLRCFTTSSKEPVSPVFLEASKFQDKLAVVSRHGKYTYRDLIQYSSQLAKELTFVIDASRPSRKKASSKFSLKGERVAFLCENDMSYIVTQWAVWLCGGIAVPLCKSHPVSELEYFVEDSEACLLVASKEYKGKLKSISEDLGVPLKVLSMDDYSGDYDETVDLWGSSGGNGEGKYLKEAVEGDMYRNMKAMIVYTSGTTGRPKGVVHTHGSLDAQIKGMIEAWHWTPDDVILHVLPLHHVHGIVNVLMTPLYCGATCVMLTKFDAKSTWSALLSEMSVPQVNLFMAVPTIYAKLLEEYEEQQIKGGNCYIPDNVKYILQNKIRLMVSGSAALPQPVMDRWERLTGHTLLERYGMTEIGMGVTNPLEGTRVPGAVGRPFPGVSVRIVNHHENGTGYDVIAEADSRSATATPGMEDMSGELLVKGDNVFREYWNKPEATLSAFTGDGWFKTGDTAVYKDGVIRIVGRTSVDVIKSGAYKISALDIERHLLAHPDIRDVAVLGLPDETWGQKIAAVMVLKNERSLDLDQLKAWARDKMAPYHIPRLLKCLDEMPRNAMGKVNKKELSKAVFPEFSEK